MGVIKRGILGGFSGSVGNVVGSSWKGIATMKAKPLSVANPNTAGQVAQRTKLANAVAYAKEILTATIKPLNDRFASGQSGFNLWLSRNIDQFAAVPPAAPANIVMSQGNVTPAASMSFGIDDSSNQASGFWLDNTGSGDALATDEAYTVLYNRNTNDFLEDNSAIRSDGGNTIAIPATWLTGHVVDCYVSFRRADGTKVSNTAYFQATIVA